MGRRVHGWLVTAACTVIASLSPIAAAQDSAQGCGVFENQTFLPISARSRDGNTDDHWRLHRLLRY